MKLSMWPTVHNYFKGVKKYFRVPVAEFECMPPTAYIADSPKYLS